MDVRFGKPSVTFNIPFDLRSVGMALAIDLEPVAQRVTDPGELLNVAGLVLKKFPRPGRPAPAAVLEGVAVVRLRPTIVSLLDYSRSFGQTDLIELGGRQASPDHGDARLP